MLLSTRIATRSISRFRCSSSSIATRSIAPFRCISSSSMASFSTATTEPQVTVAHHNNSTILTLSRPKKLNSLTLQMIHELDQGFQQGLSNNTKVFLMDGAGSKSFCAGGDVAAVRAAGLGLEGDKSLTRDFFFHEYRLNKKIGDINETIPQVSVWDGITM
jgi:enoyl-CoA hydratase